MVYFECIFIMSRLQILSSVNPFWWDFTWLCRYSILQLSMGKCTKWNNYSILYQTLDKSPGGGVVYPLSYHWLSLYKHRICQRLVCKLTVHDTPLILYTGLALLYSPILFGGTWRYSGGSTKFSVLLEDF